MKSGFLATILVLIALLLTQPRDVQGQELEISVSPTPVGSGARAAGMANAFVAIADDATAASWNPAGLVQLERPELSLVGSFNAVIDSFSASYHPELDSSHQDSNEDLNYLSVAYPLPFLVLGRNVCVSLNYQRKYDFTRSFVLDHNISQALGSGMLLNRFLSLEFEQEGGLSAISPAIAIEVTHRLSIGATLNLWRSSFLSENDWNQTIRVGTSAFLGADTIVLANTQRHESYEGFSGENLVLGMLWNPVDRWSLGLRYDTAFTGEAKYRSKTSTTQMALPGIFRPGFLGVNPSSTRETRRLRFPDSLAVGAAFRMNDRLTLSADVTRTDWNDFYVEDEEGNRNSLVDFSDLRNPWTRPRFDPTYTLRVGAEYVFVPKEPDEILGKLWTLRGGLFYDEEPASGKGDGFRWPGDNGNGKPEAFYGMSIGAGLLLGQRVNLDAAYQLRYGNDVNADFVRGIKGFQEDVFQHRFLVSTVVYF